jgi:glutamate synthase (NADPH/NADH) small chain
MGDIRGFLKVKRQPANYRSVCERIKDFADVAVLLSAERSGEQASRCMDCGTPFCHWGCPIGNYIPEWNDLVFRGNWEKAWQLLEATNNFPEITGRLCPATCEYACVLGINDDAVTIRENELAIIEHAFKRGLIRPRLPKKRTGKSIAVVGSGPAGLSCADQLNKAGHSVVVFERDDKIGGILRYGIPDFKLEKWIINRRLDILKKEGIEFMPGVNVGRDYKIFPNEATRRGYSSGSRNLPKKFIIFGTRLKKEFDAICLSCGSRVPRDLKIEGRDLREIYFAMDYLAQSNRRVAGEKIPFDKLIDVREKRVVVIGGGDTGADCVGVANRQGASCVTQIELLPKPAQCRTCDFPWPEYPMILKVSSSHEEGVKQEWSVITKKFMGESGKLKKLCCVKAEFEKDNNGCAVIKEIPGTEFEIDADVVILALGFLYPEKGRLIEGIALDEKCNVKTDDNYMTKVSGVFSCGDMHRGQSLVVWAIAEGKEAAYSIDKYLMGSSVLTLKPKSF